ncbi:TATA box-binding protein-like [Trichinella spiralis]|uniref:TATA box-binding protein-like n=1 Tax=Trichinella spiralis TaxID=6334 RepID=A0ABR3KYQ4_TRISP
MFCLVPAYQLLFNTQWHGFGGRVVSSLNDHLFGYADAAFVVKMSQSTCYKARRMNGLISSIIPAPGSVAVPATIAAPVSGTLVNVGTLQPQKAGQIVTSSYDEHCADQETIASASSNVSTSPTTTDDCLEDPIDLRIRNVVTMFNRRFDFSNQKAQVLCENVVVRKDNQNCGTSSSLCRLPSDEHYGDFYEPELSIGLVWRSASPKATLRIHSTVRFKCSTVVARQLNLPPGSKVGENDLDDDVYDDCDQDVNF